MIKNVGEMWEQREGWLYRTAAGILLSPAESISDRDSADPCKEVRGEACIMDALPREAENDRAREGERERVLQEETLYEKCMADNHWLSKCV